MKYDKEEKAIVDAYEKGKMKLSFPTKKEISNILKKEEIDVVHLIVPTPISFQCIKPARKLGIKILLIKRCGISVYMIVLVPFRI